MKITKKAGLIIAGATLAVVMVVSLGAVAFAARPNGAQVNGVGIGTCSDSVAQLLNMTTEEIRAQRLEGKSLVEIAAAKGVTQEQLVSTIMAERQLQVQARVTEGTLTQEQATYMLQNMEQNIIRAINRTTVGRPEWAGTYGAGQGIRGAGNGICQGEPGTNTGLGLGRQMRGNR